MATDLFKRVPTPEDAGISSGAVSLMLDRLAAKQLTMHSFMLVRGGKVAAEGCWKPFHKDDKHRMYSVSKSFVSLAVGCLIGEGKLALTDQVWKFFPDVVPEGLHPYLREATVRDLLMMSTPHNDQSYTVHDPNWVWTFFNTKPTHPAGTVFQYDTAGTVVLCTIVERMTGMTFLEYLRPRLLDPIGAGEMSCIQTPEGTSWGGSGVLCTMEDMARIASVCMNHGMWDGKQLVPRDYIDQATSYQMDNTMGGGVGYGYQIWRMPQNGFGFFGMGSQYAFCFPDKDFIFACTADTQCNPPMDAQAIKSAALELVEGLQDSPLSADPDAAAKLAAQIDSLTLPLIPGETSSPMAAELDGVWYAMQDNPMGIKRMRLVLTPGSEALEYENARGEKRIDFGIGQYKQGLFPEYYFDERIGKIGNRHYRCFANAAWTQPHKLYLRVCVADTYFGGLQIELSFKGAQLGVHMSKIAEWFLDDYQGFAGGERVSD